MHYWYNVSVNMRCEDIYPTFLLYNVKTNTLKSFGWSVPLRVRSAAWEQPPRQVFGVAQLIYFIYFASPQGQGYHNSVSQLLWARIPCPTLSTFPVGRNRSTRRKPTTFGRALTILFSHEDWVQIHLTGDRTRSLRGERRVV